MKYRIDEKSGNRLSALGFGIMRLPKGVGGVGAIDMKKSERLIMKAIGEGVNYIDCAYLYAGSEAALGKILSANNARDKVYIATKLPITKCKKNEDFDRFFSEQLASLQTDHVDYYLMHNINDLIQWQGLKAIGIEKWIERKKSAGQIKQIGFSFHGTRAEFLKVIDDYDWDFCQIQYNYSDENYQAGVTGLRRAAQKHMPVIIMEPLLGGKLANGLPKRVEDTFKRVNPNLSPAAWGLRWLLNQPEVTVILSGMNGDDQLTDNLRTADSIEPRELTSAELTAYAEAVKIFRESYKIPCTGCGYCLPCPQGINIPGCFASHNASYAIGRVTGFVQYVTSTGANRVTASTASKCAACGKCARHCPQNIDIPNRMKDVARRMEPLYMKLVIKAIRKVV
ncbi:MAG: aldo/keto reductase [Oscillospiraceae bacterium]|jgi:predicted aldo/keto reductase-like oxidoreductase|nr:aldo/keto reductase [Oscillospiraceae bacterium]